MNAQLANSAARSPAQANRPVLVWPPATVEERDVVRHEAIERAHALRSEAIDEFWRGTEQWWLDAAVLSRRAGDRLAARLRRHRQQRASAAGLERAAEV